MYPFPRLFLMSVSQKSFTWNMKPFALVDSASWSKVPLSWREGEGQEGGEDEDTEEMVEKEERKRRREWIVARWAEGTLEVVIVMF